MIHPVRPSHRRRRRYLAAFASAALLALPALVVTQTAWTIRLRALQSPLPTGACTPIEVIVRDGTGATPVRPGGMQVTWQDFDFAITSGREGFSWRNNDPRSRFLCATAPGVTATITVSYPGAHVPAGQRAPGIQASQTLQVASVGPPGAGTSSPAAGARTPTAATSPPPARTAPAGAPPKAAGTGPQIMADEVAVGSGDFSDVISMVFGEQRFVDGATVILDSPLELHERTIDGLRFTRALKTRDRWTSETTIARGQRYSPTRADLARAGGGPTPFGITLKHVRSGSTITSTLRYFIPDRAPAAVEARERHARLLISRVFDALVPPVYAQGAPWVGSTAESIAKRVVEQGVKTWESNSADMPRTRQAVQVGLKGREYANLAEKLGNIALETRAMLMALDEMRKCVERPTNPLTAREFSQNPGEKQKALDGLDAAASEIATNGAVRGVNALTGQAAGAVEVSGVAAGMAVSEAFSQIEDWSEGALKDASSSTFNDAMKSVVGCGQPQDTDPSLIPLEPMTVDITYQYNRTTSGCNSSGCGTEREKREATGQALINPLPGRPAMYYELRGTGSVKWMHEIDSAGAMTPGRCGTFPWTGRDTTLGVMTGRVEGTRVPGKISRLKLTMSGNNLQKTTQRLVTVNRDRDGKIECEVEVVSADKSVDGAGFSFQCEFSYVDLISGGTFATFSNEKERGYGTCVVSLARASGR